MQQIHRRLLTVLILLCTAGLATWLMQWQEQHLDQQTAAKARKHQLFSAEKPERITRITLNNQAGSFELERQDLGEHQGQWLITSPLLSLADGNIIEQLLRYALQAQIESYIESPPPDPTTHADPKGLARWGLARPRITLSLQDRDNLRETVSFGKQNSFDGRLYVQQGSRQEIGLMAQEGLENLEKALFDLRDKRLIQSAPNRWHHLQVWDEQGKTSFAMAKTAADWQLVQPVQHPVDGETAQMVIDALTGVQAKLFVVEAQQNGGRMAEFGLHRPKFTVQIQAEQSAPITLVFAQRTIGQEHHYFASHQGSGYPIMALNSDWIFRKLSTPVSELRFRQLLSVSNEQVHRFRIQRDKQVVDFTRTQDDSALGGKWHWTETASQAVLESKVQSLLHRITHLKATSLLESKADARTLESKGASQPTCEIMLFDKDNTLLDSLWIGAKDQQGHNYIGSRQQKSLGLILGTTLDEFSSTPQDYMDTSALEPQDSTQQPTIDG